jgi:hypothetical protein
MPPYTISISLRAFRDDLQVASQHYADDHFRLFAAVAPGKLLPPLSHRMTPAV